MASQVTTVYTYQLNGVTVDFKIPFDYLSRKFVKVTLLGKDRKELTFMTDYRFMSPTMIRTTKAWGPSDNYNYIEIRRETSARDLIVDFSDGSILRAGDLNTANLQAMHIAEEARSLAADSLGVDDFGNLDARFRKIVNLGDPVGRKDAVNKGYIDDAKDGVIQSRDKALQYRNEAQRFRNEAESFKNQTNTLKGQAETAKTGAESAKNTAVSKASEASSSATKASQAMASAQGSANNAVTSEKKAKASETAAAGSAKRAEDAAAKAVGGGIPMVNLLQTTGQGTDKVMSQKAVTDLMIPKSGGEFSGAVTVPFDFKIKNGNVRILRESGFSGIVMRKDSDGSYGFLNRDMRDGTLSYENYGASSTLQYKTYFPRKSGTLALADDYVPMTGGTFSGIVTLKGDPNFFKATATSSEYCELALTSKANKTFKVGIGPTSCYMNTTLHGSTVSYLLPNKGGTLALAEDYVPKTGGTFSGAIAVDSKDNYDAIVLKSNKDRVTIWSDKIISFYSNKANLAILPAKSGTIALVGQYKLDSHYKRTRSSIAKSKLSEREMRKEIEDLKAQVQELRETLLNVTN